MQTAKQLIENIDAGKYDDVFRVLYPHATDSKERYAGAIRSFTELFGENEEIRLFSVPGRTEVGGNHTDHQHGCVLAAGVDLDIIAVAAKNDSDEICIQSAGFPMDRVRIDELEPVEKENEKAIALIRGIAARFKQLGYKIGGFNAYTTSKVLKGSGLSSSAAFEVMVCTLLNSLYNDGKMDAVQKAIVSQYAENVFFNKPCGLMDQTACSVGGFVAIDFHDPKAPVVEKVDFDFASVDHSLCIVDTGGSHSDLTNEYAAIPAEMKAVANAMGKEVLRDVDEDAFYADIPALRQKVSDRAILRAIHFFHDNKRAISLRDALKKGDFEAFKQTITASGRSSLSFLQNVFAASSPQEQGLTLALAVTERILNGQGAFRVHGGGFAGTIQAFVPNALLDTYKREIEAIFGPDSCYVLSIRPYGGIEVTEDLTKTKEAE